MRSLDNRIEDVFNFCFKEMFLRVGLTYPDEKFTSNKEWFRQRSWTEEQEKDFQKWMVGYLRKKLKWNKKNAEWEVSLFLLSYGWTTNRPLIVKGIRK